MIRFTAVIHKVGINPCVDVPAEASAALGRTGYVPVRGTLDGHAFRAGLVSLGGGRHRLFVNGVMRTAAGVDTGDSVEIALAVDPDPRELPVPDALREALDADPRASAAWEMLTPSRRKEILAYLNHLKHPTSVQRNVERAVARLVTSAE